MKRRTWAAVMTRSVVGLGAGLGFGLSSSAGAMVGTAMAPIAACGLVACASAGCYQQPTFKGTKTAAVSHVASKGLRAVTSNGAIRVVQGTGAEVTITAKIAAMTQARLDGAAIVAQRNESGELSISVSWPDGKPQAGEQASFDIAVPDVSAITLNTSNGAVEVEGLGGDADLSTSNGKIIAKGFAGAVSASTSNGSVTLTGVSNAKVKTSNGSVKVELAPGAEGPADIQSSNGSIELMVGSGFAGEVTCATSNGRVTNSAGGKAVGSASKNKGTFLFGEGGKASSLRTSNGSITVSGASGTGAGKAGAGNAGAGGKGGGEGGASKQPSTDSGPV